MDKKISNRLMFVIIFILVIWWITDSFYKDGSEYERCVDDCVYDNEFCADDFLEYDNNCNSINTINGLKDCKYISEREYDSCHNNLKNCLKDCD